MNNYHIYEEVGRGKYSVVYKGRKKKSIEYVAVKSVERGRRKKLMDEVKADDDIILFIDEVLTLIGAGAAEGAIDAANILKPALARGELQCIGATTIDEYRKHIEKDPALERRFQPVQVPEPSVD